MSFFSNLGQTIAKVTVEPLAKGTASYINALFGTNIKAMTTEEASKTSFGKAYNTVLGASAIIAAVNPLNRVISSAGGVSAVASKAATTILTKPATVIKGAVVVGSGIVASNILVSSSKAREAVINAPSSLSNFGQNLGQVIENPSKDNILQTVKENPIVSSVAVASTAALVGYGTSNLIASVANTAAIKNNTNASNNLNKPIQLPPVETKESTQPIQIINQIPASSPVAASSQIGKQPSKKTKKRKSQAKKKKKQTKKKKKSIKRKKNKK